MAIHNFTINIEKTLCEVCRKVKANNYEVPNWKGIFVCQDCVRENINKQSKRGYNPDRKYSGAIREVFYVK